MTDLATLVAKWHSPMDRSLLKLLSIALALSHVALFMWQPQHYAEHIGGFNHIIGPLFIWSLCSSVIYGIGFKPTSWYWQLLFSPYISLSFLVYLSAIYILHL